jgi:hypothetical protein
VVFQRDTIRTLHGSRLWRCEKDEVKLLVTRRCPIRKKGQPTAELTESGRVSALAQLCTNTRSRRHERGGGEGGGGGLE